MTERLELYKCNICGNLIEVILPGVGELVCCGEPMEFLEAKKEDSEYGEKHVPVFTTTDSGLEIRVGSELHPMTEQHYIQFIETISEDKKRAEIQFLTPKDQPIMTLNSDFANCAREYCNLHGLWMSEK